MPVDEYRLFGLSGFPEITPISDLVLLILESSKANGGLQNGDIVVVASKIVSKAEGRYLPLKNIVPSLEAENLSKITGKPAKVCQVVINESKRYWTNGSALLARTKHGFELSSAGVDRVNDELLLLLPLDPDASAQRISSGVFEKTGVRVAVIISDSQGRPDRAGAGAMAVGCYGIAPLRVSTIYTDDGKAKHPDETLCDLLASAAAVIMGQRGRGVPVVCIRGIKYDFDETVSVKSILHD